MNAKRKEGRNNFAGQNFLAPLVFLCLLHVGGHCRVPFVSLWFPFCIPLFPFVSHHVGGQCQVSWAPRGLPSCVWGHGRLVFLDVGSRCRVRSLFHFLCLPSCGLPMPGSWLPSPPFSPLMCVSVAVSLSQLLLFPFMRTPLNLEV